MSLHGPPHVDLAVAPRQRRLARSEHFQVARIGLAAEALAVPRGDDDALGTIRWNGGEIETEKLWMPRGGLVDQVLSVGARLEACRHGLARGLPGERGRGGDDGESDESGGGSR